MKTEIKELLKESFKAPEPEDRQRFLKTIRPREISTLDLLLQQARFIRLPVWLVFFLTVALAILGSLLKLDDTESLIPAVMPFAAAVAVLETGRSGKYGMTELEMATRFSLRSVIFARMTVLGAVTLFVLCVSSPVIAAAFGGKTAVTAVRLMIPYLVTMIISLHVERTLRGRNEGYASLVVAAAVFVSVLWFDQFQPAIVLKYINVLSHRGFAIVAVLAAAAAFEQWKTITRAEAYA